MSDTNNAPVPPPHPALVNTRAQLAHGLNGDVRATAAAVAALVDALEPLLHQIAPPPSDKTPPRAPATPPHGPATTA